MDGAGLYNLSIIIKYQRRSRPYKTFHATSPNQTDMREFHKGEISAKIFLANILAKLTGTAFPTILYPSAIYLYLKMNSSGKV